MKRSLAILLFSTLALIVFHRFDHLYQFNWLIFYWWLINFSALFILVLVNIPKNSYLKFIGFIKQDRIYLTAILILAVITRFALLSTYPYITIADEVRDAGLNAVLIRTGAIKDFFGFGSYEGYGVFIPVISYFFLPFFKHSSLIYLIPTAFFGVLTIMLTYLCMRFIFGRLMALASSIFIIGSILHLHYSRSYFVVTSDALFSIIIILLVYISLTYRRLIFYLLTGLIIGLSIQFYSGIWALVLSAIIYLFLQNLAFVFYRKHNQRLRWRQFLDIGIFFLIGLIAGIGPKLNNFNLINLHLSNSSHTGTFFTTTTFTSFSIIDKSIFLINNYVHALLSYVYEPMKSIYLYYKMSFVDFPINLLFIIGFVLMVFAWRKKEDQRFLTRLLLIAVLFIPMINQVLVNQIGYDYRMFSLIPVTAMISAYALIRLTNKFLNRK